MVVLIHQTIGKQGASLSMLLSRDACARQGLGNSTYVGGGKKYTSLVNLSKKKE